MTTHFFALACTLTGLSIAFQTGDNAANNAPTPVAYTCEAQETPTPTPLSSLQALKLPSDSGKSYAVVKREIAASRQRLAAGDTAALQEAFETALLNRIIPFWEGTPWTFEGHTSKPQEGSIACGYFVSTTLQHVGLNLNRYKLAQRGPLDEATSLALGTPLIHIEAGNTEANITAIQSQVPNGIHFLGFDRSHVGYLYKTSTDLYVIHSNYIGSSGVTLEPAYLSPALTSCSRFHIAELSTNARLLGLWLNGGVLLRPRSSGYGG